MPMLGYKFKDNFKWGKKLDKTFIKATKPNFSIGLEQRQEQFDEF
jgi:hypothetical protein